jgi:putative peptidoglycan lipid II flippase
MNLLKVLATVSSLTLLSRVTGLIRDLLVARFFGASAATDAFFLAFSLPNLLRRLFAEGAFSQAFVPILGEYKNSRGEEQTRILIDDVATLLFWMLMLVTAIGVIAAPLIIYIVAPGFADEPERFSLAVQMLRIMWPYILLISLVAFAGGILNTYSRFSIPAFTPVLLNLSFIVAMLGFAHFFHPPIYVLAWAVLAGGVAQLLLQWSALRRIGKLPRIRWNLRRAWADEGVKRILRQMGPAVLGVSVAQISIVINRIFQSFLETGSISWLFYADRLMEFPTGMLGVALGTILIPFLTKAHVEQDHSSYNQLLDWGLRLTFLLALPASVALAILSLPLIATLFHQGQFSARDALMSAQALTAYAVGLLGLISVKVLAPAFYAKQDIKTPVKIAVLVLMLTQLMNLAFIGWLKHAGLALSISLAACINAALLYSVLRKRGVYQPAAGWRTFLLKLSVVLIVFGVALYWAQSLVPWLQLAAQPWKRAVFLGLMVVGGALLYFALLFVLGFRLKDFRRRA